MGSSPRDIDVHHPGACQLPTRVNHYREACNKEGRKMAVLLLVPLRR